MLASRLSAMLLCCTSSYPGGGSFGGGSCPEDSLFACAFRSRSLSATSMLLSVGREALVGVIGVGRWIVGVDAIVGEGATSSYAGSCSRSTFDKSIGRPLSLATSEACDSDSFMRSYVDEKSNAPPSLNVILSFTKACCGGIPPPVTGWRIPNQMFGPKKGAETWVSVRFWIGAEKDFSWRFVSVGR